MVYSFKKQKRSTIVNAFQNVLDNSKRKSNRIGFDKGTQFYNGSFKKWFQDNDIEMSLVAERLIRTLKNKIYKHMIAVSKNIHFDVLNDIADKYNNSYHRTIKMKSTHVKSVFCTEYSVDSNAKSPKLKIGGHTRILKYKNIFAKRYTPNWSEVIFVINEI